MSMDIEKIRADFEAWARRRGIALWLHPNGSGKYYCGAAQQAFEAWIESRAALVVELPVRVTRANGFDSSEDDEFYNLGIDHCARQISAVGITIKEGAR